MRYNARRREMPVPGWRGGKRMNVLKVTTVGNSVGVILPREILERLRVGKGDSLYVVETKNGIQLTAYDPAFAEQVEAAERVMREDRDALKKLAE
jgi:putative addiction module antidote